MPTQADLFRYICIVIHPLSFLLPVHSQKSRIFDYEAPLAAKNEIMVTRSEPAVEREWMQDNTNKSKEIGLTQATGGLISNLPLVCGGNTYDGSYIPKCFVIGSYNTDEIKLIHPRQASASLSLNDTLWITGSLTFSSGKNSNTFLDPERIHKRDLQKSFFLSVCLQILRNSFFFLKN